MLVMQQTPQSNVLIVKHQVSWLPAGSELRIVTSTELPPQELITSVHALCFSGEDILMVNHQSRGWDIPGGHVEPGEALEETLKRESREEGYVTICDITPLAMQHIRVNPSKPEGYKYPYPDSYQVIYFARLKEALQFCAEFESSERRFFTPDEAQTLAWIRDNRELYALGLNAARRQR